MSEHPWLNQAAALYTRKTSEARKRYLADLAMRMSLAKHAGNTVEPPYFDRPLVESEAR